MEGSESTASRTDISVDVPSPHPDGTRTAGTSLNAVPSTSSVGRGGFGVSREQLMDIMEERSYERLEEIGGVAYLAKALKTDLKTGCPGGDGDGPSREEAFGDNTYPEAPSAGFWSLWFSSHNDPILLILMVAACVSIILGVSVDAKCDFNNELDKICTPETEIEVCGPRLNCEQHGVNSTTSEPIYMCSKGSELGAWVEGVAILMAVEIVAFVTAGNDYSKEKKFRELKKVKDDHDIIVMRGGKRQKVSIFKLLVGDVVILESGDQVPGDGVFIQGYNVSIDESVMTGESAMQKKREDRPFMLSGTQVNEGVCTMLVLAVGISSAWGQALALLDESNEGTPLQAKLLSLAKLIGTVGVLFGVMTFVGLLLAWGIRIADRRSDADLTNDDMHLECLVDYIIISLTIVVVAVPEGLPLAVTISLAYSMRRMLKDNNLVRHLEACETMGGATNICSDKTGTLTENRMTVVCGQIGQVVYDQRLPKPEEVDATVLELYCEGISVNSKAAVTLNTETGRPEFQGNKTEGALLYSVVKNFNVDYEKVRQEFDSRVRQVYTFSSDRKRMGTIVRLDDDSYRLYCKGAAELVFERCTHMLNENGIPIEVDDELRAQGMKHIEDMASSGLRTISLAYRDFDADGGEAWNDVDNTPEDQMTLIATVGIKDPLRPEVYAAIAQAKRSGIKVRMVTGDNILTARHIARECGILTEGGVALEGSQFRVLSDKEMEEVMPKLDVLARSTPIDKHTLVRTLKRMGEVVAVTGDGTNDAPALHEADVGLSMGLSGTEVAKEASDIVILDDNFSSIIKSVLWGRSVYENIRKFLQFQLTINVVALLTTFIASVTLKTDEGLPLTAVQLLWINLIMDTLAALALATEPPTPDLLDRKPYGRKDALITKVMWRNIFGQATFQLIIVLTLLYAGSGIFDVIDESEEHFTILFNTFVFLQVFNEFNSRKINDERNIFANIIANPIFSYVTVVTVVLQALIIEFGGEFTSTKSLSVGQWFACIGMGALGIPVGFLIRMIPVPDEEAVTDDSNDDISRLKREIDELRRQVDRKADELVQLEERRRKHAPAVESAPAAEADASGGPSPES